MAQTKPPAGGTVPAKKPVARKATEFPALRGRVDGVLPGKAPAERMVVLRRPGNRSRREIAHALVRDDGSFEMPGLPQSIRDTNLVVEVIAPGAGGPTIAASSTLRFPTTGDGVVVLATSSFGAAQLSEHLLAQTKSNADFAQARLAASVRAPQQDVDWVAAGDYLEALDGPLQRAGSYVRARDLGRFDFGRNFKRPTHGLAGTPPPRDARLKLTVAEQATLQTATPTLCDVVGAPAACAGSNGARG